MRQLFVCLTALSLLALCSFAPQGTPGGTTGRHQYEALAESKVAALLSLDHSANLDLSDERLIRQLGDGAAFGTIQYIGGRKGTGSDDEIGNEQLRRILSIIRVAFSAPAIIQPAENRRPKATLVLLKYLRCLPAADTLRGELDETERTIIEQTSRFSRDRKMN